MPTHFSKGVNRESPGALAYELPDFAPYGLISYYNDFMTYVAGDWTITESNAGTTAVMTTAGTAGGYLLRTNAAADNDTGYFDLKGEAFKWASTNRMWFGARFKVSDATLSDVVIGLQITDTTPLDVTDGFTFIKVKSSTDLNFLVEKNNTATTTLVGTVADDTFMTVGFFYDNVDGLFHIFLNNVEVATSVATNAVDDEDLTVSFGIKNGEAVAKLLTIDYIWAAQNRTPTTDWS